MRIVLLALILIATPAVAQTHEVTIHARSEGCSAGDVFCFTMDGSLDDIEPGDDVTITFVNDDDTFHELVVAPLSEADPEHKATSEDNALGEIEEIGPGEQETATFTVPAGGMYLWCALPGHESAGMWIEAPAPGGEDSPAPVSFLFVALLLAGLVARHRP